MIISYQLAINRPARNGYLIGLRRLQVKRFRALKVLGVVPSTDWEHGADMGIFVPFMTL